MQVGVARQHVQEHSAVGPHLHHPSNAGIGVIITDEDELPLLDDDTR